MTGEQRTKLKVLRYLSYWLYFFISVGTPIALIAWQFEIFKQPKAMQLTAYGIIAVIIFIFLVRGKMKEAISDMDKGIPRTILRNLQKFIPYIACWMLITFLDDMIIKVRFVMFWTIIAQAIAAALDLWHTTIIKRLERGHNEANQTVS